MIEEIINSLETAIKQNDILKGSHVYNLREGYVAKFGFGDSINKEIFFSDFLNSKGYNLPVVIGVINRNEINLPLPKKELYESVLITKKLNAKSLREIIIEEKDKEIVKRAIKNSTREIKRLLRGGIYPGDVNPANFMVDETGKVYLLDFESYREVRKEGESKYFYREFLRVIDNLNELCKKGDLK